LSAGLLKKNSLVKILIMNKAIFIDRDGVICKDTNYLHRIQDFKFIDKAVDALKLLSKTDYKIIIVTNQAGIAHGFYSEEDFHKLNSWMINNLKNKGIRVDKVYYCPHHPDAKVAKYKIDCNCRKPNIVMLKKAEKELNIDLKNSFLVGDKTSDIKTGENAGCKTILVKTGYAGKDKKYNITPDFTVKNLYEAFKLILKGKTRISMIGTLPPIKGVSDYCIELSQSMSKYIDVDFISFKKIYPEFLYPGGTKDTDKNFKIEENKNLKIRNLITYYNPFTWAWAGLSAKSKIVHIQWWTSVLAPIYLVIFLFLKLKRKKIILTIHNIIGHETGLLDKIITKIIFSFPDILIVHSDKNIEQIKDIFYISDNRIVKIPHGIYNFYKNTNISKTEARTKLKIKQNIPVVLSFGNIREYKGVDVLIKAFSVVKKELPDALLVIAGKCWIDWKDNEKLIEKYSLKKDIITFLDYVPMSDVKLYFESCDLVALPYKEFEAQSGPGNIALAFHKPLVVTNVGALPDLVKNKKCVLEVNDIKGIANQMIKILKDKKLAKELSKESKELCKDFSWEGIAKKTIKLYEGILK